MSVDISEVTDVVNCVCFTALVIKSLASLLSVFGSTVFKLACQHHQVLSVRSGIECINCILDITRCLLLVMAFMNIRNHVKSNLWLCKSFFAVIAHNTCAHNED